MNYDFYTLNDNALYDREHTEEKHHVSQTMRKRGRQALVHWSVEFLWAISAVLPAGLSCQVDRVV